MEQLRVTQLFSGIGFQLRGFELAGCYDVVPVQTCEMDLYAIQAYAAVHNGMDIEMINNYEYPSRQEMADYLIKLNIGYDFCKKKPYDWQKKVNSKRIDDLNKTWLACKLSNNLGDICGVTEIEDCDMLTFSYPCTDLSQAGLMKGMIKGETRSGLVYEVLRILHNTEHLPKYLLLENVPALVNKKNLPQFEEINEEFSEIGYNCYWKVLSANECGIPQSRDRVFGLYVRKDVDNGNFTFPLPFDNGMRMEDLLDPEDEWKPFFYETEKALAFLKNLIIGKEIINNEYK